jgi:hypothetical protein
MQIAPAVGVDYLQRNTALAAIMLQVVAEEWNRAAARRVEENSAMRELFADARAVVADQPLAQRLAEEAAGADADLRISALDAANTRLRKLLIELHAHVETLGTAEAQRIEAAIWAELKRSTERRQILLAPF